MKRCPTCQKTFDDNMRFCQTDGTPLVEDAIPADPYKTMVASKEDIASALRSQEAAAPDSPGIGAPEQEPLELPSEPASATPASEFETKIAGRDVIEIPPLAETPPPEPPKFNEPSTPPPPSFGDQSAPPSPFSSQPSPFSSQPPGSAGDFPTTPPIPSPFGESKPPSFEPPAHVPEPEPEDERTYFEPEPPAPAAFEPEPAAQTPQFAEPEPARQFDPFEQQSSSPGGAVAQTEWTPPAAQGGTGMQQPPPMAGTKQNQILPIVSLVTGILSVCCWISPVTGIVALVTGFLGIKNVKNDPAHYGGKTLAIVGMILGGLFFVLGIVYWIVMIFFNGAAMLMQLANQG
jgi:hypothetical protein